MHQAGQFVPQVIFGWNALWVSTVILVLVYVIIMTERVNRAIIALLGAGIMIQVGVLSQEEAVKGVDFNTIALLTGMMLLVAITRQCGVFQAIAIWSAKKSNASPWGILLMLQVTTAFLSSL